MPRRHDVGSGGEDIQARAKVGERGSIVARGGRAHGDGERFAGWRHRARTHIGIAGCDDERNAIGHTTRYRQVECGRARPAEAHVGNRWNSTLVVGDDPVDSSDDVGGATRATAVHDANRHDEGGWRHAVVGAGNGAGNVRAVAMAVAAAVAVTDARETRCHATSEVAVGGAHAGVDHVCRDARTRLCARVSRIER